jgi:hypothetical protein
MDENETRKKYDEFIERMRVLEKERESLIAEYGKEIKLRKASLIKDKYNKGNL